MKSIDINCDLGEGTGIEESIMPFISSANIACGYHAGDEKTIGHAVELCLKNNIAIGAHPSFFDRENFGRTEMKLNPQEIYDLVTQQLYILNEILDEQNAPLHHVKPHGALYNLSAKDIEVAGIIAQAVYDFNPQLILFGLSESCSISEAEKAGLKTCNEVFADRRYMDDGSLVPRSKQGSVIENTNMAVTQALQLVKENTVITHSGKKLQLKADTICLHGDGTHAVDFAKAIYEAFKREEIIIRAN